MHQSNRITDNVIKSLFCNKKAFSTLTVRTLLKRPIRSRQMTFNMPNGTFSWCFYKRTSFRTVSESHLHTLDFLWNVVKSVSVWFPQSRPAPVLMCEDTSEDTRVPSVWHVACNQSDSRLVWISTGQRDWNRAESLQTLSDHIGVLPLFTKDNHYRVWSHTSFTLVYFLKVFRVHPWRWICGLLTSTD